MKLRGSAIVLGNNINTGIVIAAKYMSKQGDPKSLIPHMFEAIDPAIPARLPGAILVAGTNFGVGSTREIVPVLLREAGVRAVVARSFSRGFYRNATNLGLPLAEAEVAGTEGGDLLEIDLDTGVVRNLTRSTEVRAIPLPKIMQRILAEGGLVPFFKKYRSLT
jgi:3-isopropylmalate/(R)-2-methylmalate dehydratase small subunit